MLRVVLESHTCQKQEQLGVLSVYDDGAVMLQAASGACLVLTRIGADTLKRSPWAQVREALALLTLPRPAPALQSPRQQ